MIYSISYNYIQCIIQCIIKMWYTMNVSYNDIQCIIQWYTTYHTMIYNDIQCIIQWYTMYHTMISCMIRLVFGMSAVDTPLSLPLLLPSGFCLPSRGYRVCPWRRLSVTSSSTWTMWHTSLKYTVEHVTLKLYNNIPTYFRYPMWLTTTATSVMLYTIIASVHRKYFIYIISLNQP